MDIEKFSNLEVDTASTKSISDACNEMKKLENEIEQAEELLSLKKAKHKDYQERKIPVKPFYGARIPESRTEEAFGWLREKGFGDLIKNTVTTTFNRGQDNQVAELVKVCENFGFKYLQKQKVEPMTLKAFAKEQVEKGKELPFDLFGIYIANKAKLKTKE